MPESPRMDVRLYPVRQPQAYERISAFYARERSDVLPPPTTKDLLDAVSKGRLIAAEDRQGRIIACTAQILLTPEGAKTYVGELTGTRVTEPLNGARPLRFHMLLLGLRLLNQAAGLPQSRAGASTSLVTIVKTSNERSLKGIRAAGFAELRDTPSWLKFDELSWHGDYVAGEWAYFFATNDTVRRVARTLIDAGLFTWRLNLENRHGSLDVQLDGFDDLRLAEADIRAIAEGRHTVDWVAPPAKIEL
jgi:hypothetical protein